MQKIGLSRFAQRVLAAHPALAAELAEEGIRVTAILPGYVATDLVKGVAPAKRMIQPEDLARTVLELCAMPESTFVDEVTVWPWRMYSD